LPWNEYWDRKAASGGYGDRYALWRDMALNLDAGQFDPEALALIAEARAAGVPVGLLSNDLVAIGGPEWVESRPEFAGFDAFVDATVLGERKPAPRPYLAAIEQFGLAPEDIVFLDDTVACIEGARAVGMIGLHVDPTDHAAAFQRARQLVGLADPPGAQALVDAAQAAYQAVDLDAVIALFHPDAVVYWNGAKVAEGHEQIRAFHRDTLGFERPPRADYRLRKTLRAAEGDTIGVEWVSTYRRDDGAEVRRCGGEFWTMRYGRLIEWKAYV
jgi:HAD superfamily hydrolase (TIGR01509 family)